MAAVDTAEQQQQQPPAAAPAEQQQQLKRKRSSSDDGRADAVSDASPPSSAAAADGLDPQVQQLAHQRQQHAAARLELEGRLQQLQEQKQHVAQQLEQLQGLEGGSNSKDAIGVSDLEQQLQAYEAQHQAATSELAQLPVTFKAAVAGILGIAEEPQLLAAAMQEQQRLQDTQVQQLAVEQQLAGSDFAVTNSSKRKSKKARLDSVWTWLQDSAGGAGEGQQQPQQQQQQQGSQQGAEGGGSLAPGAGSQESAGMQASPLAVGSTP